MKFYLRIFIVSIALFLIGSGCWGRKTYTYFFTWREIAAVEKVVVEPSGTHFIYRQTEETIFRPGTFGLRVRFKGEVSEKKSFLAAGFGWVTPVCATSVPTDDYVVADSVSHLRIEASADFDAEHPAGSDISGYFRTMWGGDLCPVGELIDRELNSTKHRREDLDSYYFLCLRESPEPGISYRFEITAVLKSGRELTCETEEIRFSRP